MFEVFFGCADCGGGAELAAGTELGRGGSIRDIGGTGIFEVLGDWEGLVR